MICKHDMNVFINRQLIYNYPEQVNRQIDREVDRQMDKQMDKQMDRQMDLDN